MMDTIDGYFPQDGAAAHTARESLRYLTQFFDDMLINRNLWPKERQILRCLIITCFLI
jgi:hypothetical protein